MTSPSRSELVAETAITLIVERGLRGLTHRAVDEAAGLPAGSTSNLARTRAALLELVMARLTELELRLFAAADLPEGGDRETVVEVVAGLLHVQLTEDRRRTLARYELALEANRRPELRAVYDASGAAFRRAAVMLVAGAGSPDPVRHGRMLVAFAEGVMFDALAGAGDDPAPEELRLAVTEFLRGMLG
ncbi:TetR/AcrR family transcriptional regulator [Actinomadura kijaniata]|uniref:TetR/AcrR family transcriptional regulator n=1 Tax=Actinomadura kijaniata TaxID=46161 RepID=UPI00082B6ED6|nr:TetR/AcrR family transcriptional regulator [Actinomadura kijaniata]